MGCDIHIVIQRQEADGGWREIVWQDKPWQEGHQPVDGYPVAPAAFSSRNYNKFAILADVRNGVGFAGIQTGEGWPSIAADRGFPEGFDETTVAPNPEYGDYPRSLGDHSFTWVSLDELKAFDWDGTLSWLYGCVPAAEYERLAAVNKRPDSYCGGITGQGIYVYDPDEYREVKAAGLLCPKPYVRMGWSISAAEATHWPADVLPWLDSLAEGRPLRLILGFDS